MRRLSISLLIVVLVSTIGLGWAIDKLFEGLVKTPVDGLQVYREVGADLVASVESAEELSSIVSAWPESNTIGLTLIDTNAVSLPTELAQQLSSGKSLELESDSDVTFFFAVPNSTQVLIVSPSPTASETPLAVALTVLFYGGMISLVLLWIYPLARRLLALGKTARAFGEGNLDKRVATHERSFLFGIENEFNSMAQRIQSLIADNKMLASAVSHDLRTPLARLRFGIDLLDEAKDEKVRQEYQLRLSNDLTTMENLVEVLLEYARLDQQLSELPKSSTNLVELINVSVESLDALDGARIDWRPVDQEMITLAHPRYVAMMINNLLQNAVNYGDGQAAISVTRKRSSLVITVEDDGAGIPAEKREQMLKPFVRGAEQESGKARKGYGMGLAIVNRIAQWHDAEFVIGQSERLGGARFDIIFPAVGILSGKEMQASKSDLQSLGIRSENG